MKNHRANRVGLRTTSLGSYSASEVARSLAISRGNAGRCAERGRIVLLCRETNLSHMIEKSLDD